MFIGKVPIMLRSDYCSLHGHTDKELTELGECPYDEGGYFVINGSEKVLIAQERMSARTTCTSSRRSSRASTCGKPNVAVNRSVGPRRELVRDAPASRRGCEGRTGPHSLHASVRAQTFRFSSCSVARFTSADKDILEHIVYDLGDNEMMEMLRLSIEEAFVIQSQEVALDFIGKRGSRGPAVSATRSDQVSPARNFAKELLPHVGVREIAKPRKHTFGAT